MAKDGKRTVKVGRSRVRSRSGQFRARRSDGARTRGEALHLSVIPGGVYDPEKFPALERLKKELDLTGTR